MFDEAQQLGTAGVSRKQNVATQWLQWVSATWRPKMSSTRLVSSCLDNTRKCSGGSATASAQIHSFRIFSPLGFHVLVLIIALPNALHALHLKTSVRSIYAVSELCCRTVHFWAFPHIITCYWLRFKRKPYPFTTLEVFLKFGTETSVGMEQWQRLWWHVSHEKNPPTFHWILVG